MKFNQNWEAQAAHYYRKHDRSNKEHVLAEANHAVGIERKAAIIECRDCVKCPMPERTQQLLAITQVQAKGEIASQDQLEAKINQQNPAQKLRNIVGTDNLGFRERIHSISEADPARNQ